MTIFMDICKGYFCHNARRAGCMLMLVAVLFPWPRAAQSQEESALVLKNVGLVALGGGTDLPGQDVIVHAGKITAVRPTGGKLPNAAPVIDCSGKWALPGLIDMHVELQAAGPDSTALKQDLLELFAGGITTVLDLSGAMWTPAQHLPAPRVLRASPLCRRPATAAAGATVVTDDNDVRSAVRSARGSGAQAVYLAPDLEPGQVKAALEEARVQDLPAVGTFLATPYEEAVRNGLEVVANLRSFVTAFAGSGDRQLLAQLAAAQPEALYGPLAAPALLKTWAKVAPPKSLRPKLQALADRAVFLMPQLALESGRLATYSMASSAADMQQLQEKYQALLRLAFDLQVPLLAGSGNAVQQHWRPALHQELEAWLAAGIAPRFVLEAATVNAGHALRQSQRLGRLAEGMLADVVVLDEHPCNHIITLRRPWLIVREGVPFPRAQLASAWDPWRPAEREIRAVLAAQVQAWNDGDLARYMRGYWQSDSTVFVSGGEVVRGWHTTRERYQRNYPTKDKMGRLEFMVGPVEFMSEDWAKVLGEWHLTTPAQRQRGLFTLILRRFAGGWRVVHDHTSTGPVTDPGGE